MSTQEQDNKKNEFYRDRYRTTMQWLTLMAIICVGLTFVLTYFSIQQRVPKFFSTTTTGEVKPMYSLSEPVVTSNYLLQWASLRARDVYNLSFAQYQKQLDDLKPYFTNAGYSKLRGALDSSGFIDVVNQQKLNTSAVVYKPPVILARLIVDGYFTWRVQLPLLVTFTSASQQTQLKYIVTMDVTRVPVISAPKGIQIKNFIVVREN